MASMFQSRAPDTAYRGFAKRMSRHVAAALVVFAIGQIFVVGWMGGSLPLHFGIVVAIGGFAAAAHALEKRWSMLEGSGLPDAGLATRFRMDLMQLWGTSLLAPLLWIPVSIVAGALFA